MTRIPIVPALALVVASCACSPALAADPVVVSCHTPGVTDGDTIRCGGERVRLWGLDAPERHDSAGPAATRALADLTKGRRVVCTEAGRRSYGRLVARCTADGVDLACAMIRQGVASEWVSFSRGAYRSCAPEGGKAWKGGR